MQCVNTAKKSLTSPKTKRTIVNITTVCTSHIYNHYTVWKSDKALTRHKANSKSIGIVTPGLIGMKDAMVPSTPTFSMSIPTASNGSAAMGLGVRKGVRLGRMRPIRHTDQRPRREEFGSRHVELNDLKNFGGLEGMMDVFKLKVHIISIYVLQVGLIQVASQS
jgi:hypothetical protein